MQCRTLAVLTLASMLALPLHTAEAGPLKDLAKTSVAVNTILARKAISSTAKSLKGAAKLTKKSLKFNAEVARCALDIITKKPTC
jgi:hypothetical protein